MRRAQRIALLCGAAALVVLWWPREKPVASVSRRYDLGAIHYSLSVHPTFAPPGARERTSDEPDFVTACGEVFQSVSLPRLRIWASDPADFPAFLELGGECLVQADQLLGDELLDLTLVVAGELPDPEESALDLFARSPRTIVIAVPAHRLFLGWLLQVVDEGLAELGRTPEERRAELPTFAGNDWLAEMTRSQVDGIVRHEIGHVALFAAFAARSGSFDGAGAYGSPLDDWLEETAAVSFEPADFGERSSHRCAVYEEAPSLEVFFGSSHPHFANRSAPDPGARPARAWLEGSVGLTLTELGATGGKRSAGKQAPEVAAADLFYPQARLFADYLHARGGPHALAALLEDALDGLEIERSLAEGRASLWLPETLPELQRDWERWLALE